MTFRQFQYESDLAKPPYKGPRLVDQGRFSNDISLWLQLLRFRGRTSGARGATIIWNELKKRKLTIPTRGDVADEVWSELVELGHSSPTVLEEIGRYAQQNEKTSGSWVHLYPSIVGKLIARHPSKAYAWHNRLKNYSPPTKTHLTELFYGAVTSPHALEVFERIYKESPARNLYSTIIPTLCKGRSYDEALKWHLVLTQENDWPPTSSAAEPLLHYLAYTQDVQKVEEITSAMVAAGVSFAPNTPYLTRQNVVLSREAMNRTLGVSHNIAPKKFSDLFCARLFATSMFSVSGVINGLSMLGLDTIGPLSLREIANREISREQSLPAALNAHIIQLQQAGISIGHSVFSRLIHKLAREDDSEVLFDVITCDLHPDAFENTKLQEQLLGRYLHKHDVRQTDRTLAVLTLDCNSSNARIVRWNLILRTHLKQKKWPKVFQGLEAMRENRVPVTAKSSTLMTYCLLSRRNVMKGPSTTADIPRIIRLLCQILSLGGHVEPRIWSELFRRLGMAGHIYQLEKLALWLVSWYSSSAKHASQKIFKADNGTGSLTPTETYQPESSEKIIRTIFSPAAQYAFIAWGFKHLIGNRVRRERKERLLRRSPLTWTDWKWGLKLVLKLKARGVPVRNKTITRVIEHRLIVLFGPGQSTRKINRMTRERNIYRADYYLDEVKRLCGDTVVRSLQLSPDSRVREAIKLEEQRELEAQDIS